MPDVVVTVPKRLWGAWIDEGGLPGQDVPEEIEYHFRVSGRPQIRPGEAVYIVAHNRLRGYAPLVRLEASADGRTAVLVRRGGAVAVTIASPIQGFRGYRYRWWDRRDERPFPEWSRP